MGIFDPLAKGEKGLQTMIATFVCETWENNIS